MGFKRRSRMRKRKRAGNRLPRRSWRNSSYAPIISIGGIVLCVAVFACLIIFLILPLLSGKFNKPENTKPTTTQAAAHDPNQIIDLTGLEKEATPMQQSINAPFILGNEMIYSSGEKTMLNPPLKTISIYYIDKNKTDDPPLSGITCKYNNLFEPKMNDKWIVFLDTKTKGGGRILGYNRKTKTMFVVREYFFGMPKLKLAGDYLAWMQQTSVSSDKIYMCNLNSNETVCIKTFTNVATSVSAVDLCNSELIWTEPVSDTGNSENMKCIIKSLPLKEGKGSQPVSYSPDTYVFEPVTNGTSIAFLDGNRGPNARLMISIDGGAPQVIETGVLNYAMGTDFVAYTKNEAVYVYFIKDGTRGRLTGDKSRGELSTVNGQVVCWYDVTDGAGMRDVIKYATIEAGKY